MRMVHYRYVAVLLVLAVSTWARASQDTIVLDPAGDRAQWRQGANTLPGASGLLRDDMFVVPADHERIICYGNNSGAIPINRIRYKLARGQKEEIVEIIDYPGGGSQTGVIVRWEGAPFQQACIHGQYGNCQYTGIPPQLFGSIVEDSLQYMEVDTWKSVTGSRWFEIQYKPTTALTCTDLEPRP